MTVATPNYDAAVELLDELVACLEANDLHVPENRGVVWCGEGFLPGCCDHVVGKLVPVINPKTHCIEDRWKLVVSYGVCAAQLDPQGKWADYGADQARVAQLMEQVISVFLNCGACSSCAEAQTLTTFCASGCDGFRLTFTL